MATNSTRAVTIAFTGDIQATNVFNAAANASTPASITIHSLPAGANTITLPASPGAAVVGATIIPPAGNTSTIALKGIAGDTGVPLHKTDPTSITFDSPPPASFVLTVTGATINGLRIVWT